MPANCRLNRSHAGAQQASHSACASPHRAAQRARGRQGPVRALRRRKCSGCTPSGGARRAASRPIAAAGEWTRLEITRRPDARDRVHGERRRRMRALVAELRERTRQGAAGRRRRSTCSATASRASCPSASGSTGCSIPARRSSSCRRWPPGTCTTTRRRRRHRDRHRPRLGTRGADRRQRRHGQGRHLLSDDREEAPARAADRAREPPAVRLPRGLRRRVPAAAGRGVSRPRPLRPHLLQPGAHVGRAASRRSPS